MEEADGSRRAGSGVIPTASCRLELGGAMETPVERRTRKRLLLQAFAGTAPGFVDWTAWTYGRAVAKRAVALARRGR